MHNIILDYKLDSNKKLAESECASSVLRLNNLMTMAQRVNGKFTLSVNKFELGWQCKCMDFISYENSQGRFVNCCFNTKTYNEIKDSYIGKHYMEHRLRDYEPLYTLHSTTLANWEKICSSGFLMSSRKLMQLSLATNLGLGFSLLKEPSDYADYIMFSDLYGFNELLINMRTKGKVNYDDKCQYEPGVRLYFDNKLIANDGLLVRDGSHYKVEHKLYINKYLVCAVTCESLDYNNEWTPKKFEKAANEYFFANYKQLNKK